jgi:hypothetical protein
MPTPSREVALPLPASVVTAAVAKLTARIKLLVKSPTKSVPLASASAKPTGLKKEAEEPMPLAAPGAPVPAKVAVTPPPTVRMACLVKSAT